MRAERMAAHFAFIVTRICVLPEQREITAMVGEAVFHFNRIGPSWAGSAAICMVCFPNVERSPPGM